MSKAKGTDGAGDNGQNKSFEEALKQLEVIVETMEAQDLPLETLIAKYEEGSRLLRSCEAKLNEAELKIQQIEKNTRGEIALKPVATESSRGPEQSDLN